MLQCHRNICLQLTLTFGSLRVGFARACGVHLSIAERIVRPGTLGYGVFGRGDRDGDEHAECDGSLHVHDPCKQMQLHNKTVFQCGCRLD